MPRGTPYPSWRRAYAHGVAWHHDRGIFRDGDMVTLSDQDCRDQERRTITPVHVHQFCNWLLLQYVWEEGVRKYGSPAHHGRGTPRPLLGRLPGPSSRQPTPEGAEPPPQEEPEQADAQHRPWRCPAYRSAIFSAVAWQRLTAPQSERLTRDQLRQLTLPFW